MTLLNKTALCDLTYSKVLSDGVLLLSSHLSSLWWQRGTAHCAKLFGYPVVWANLLSFSGLHIKTSYLRQPPSASATAFIGMDRVICSVWVGLNQHLAHLYTTAVCCKEWGTKHSDSMTVGWDSVTVSYGSALTWLLSQTESAFFITVSDRVSHDICHRCRFWLPVASVSAVQAFLVKIFALANM